MADKVTLEGKGNILKNTPLNFLKFLCFTLINYIWILFQISETEEESSLVFFEPKSPFFLLTLQIGGTTLGVFIVCGIIFEAYQRKVGKMVQTGKLLVSHGGPFLLATGKTSGFIRQVKLTNFRSYAIVPSLIQMEGLVTQIRASLKVIWLYSWTSWIIKSKLDKRPKRL